MVSHWCVWHIQLLKLSIFTPGLFVKARSGHDALSSWVCSIGLLKADQQLYKQISFRCFATFWMQNDAKHYSVQKRINQAHLSCGVVSRENQHQTGGHATMTMTRGKIFKKNVVNWNCEKPATKHEGSFFNVHFFAKQLNVLQFLLVFLWLCSNKFRYQDSVNLMAVISEVIRFWLFETSCGKQPCILQTWLTIHVGRICWRLVILWHSCPSWWNNIRLRVFTRVNTIPWDYERS